MLSIRNKWFNFCHCYNNAIFKCWWQCQVLKLRINIGKMSLNLNYESTNCDPSGIIFATNGHILCRWCSLVNTTWCECVIRVFSLVWSVGWTKASTKKTIWCFCDNSGKYEEDSCLILHQYLIIVYSSYEIKIYENFTL